MADRMISCRIKVGKDRQVRAQYHGGPYIDISFGDGPFRATEVLNVWDCETDKPEIPFSTKGVVDEVLRWATVQDQEWPEWFEGYIENASY